MLKYCNVFIVFHAFKALYAVLPLVVNREAVQSQSATQSRLMKGKVPDFMGVGRRLIRRRVEGEFVIWNLHGMKIGEKVDHQI